MGYAYAQGSVWPYAIYPELRAVWLGATLVFATGAAAVAVTFGVDAYRAGRGRALRPPPMSVLLAGIGLLGFGVIAVIVQVPHDAAYAVLVAYIDGALLLFAVGFLGYRPSPRPADRWARVLAAAHGLMGMGWGFAFALVTVLPPIVST